MKILILFILLPFIACDDTRLRMEAFRVMFGHMNNRNLARTKIKILSPVNPPNRRAVGNQRRAIKYFMRYIEEKIENYLWSWLYKNIPKYTKPFVLSFYYYMKFWQWNFDHEAWRFGNFRLATFRWRLLMGSKTMVRHFSFRYPTLENCAEFRKIEEHLRWLITSILSKPLTVYK